jgi:predicted RNase H-like nuclease (RuvC/YqgF family)
MTKNVITLTVAMAYCFALLVGCATPAAVYRTIGVHNDQTLLKVQKDYIDVRKPAAATVVETAKSSTNMIEAAKQLENSPDEKSLSKLETTTSTYTNSVEKARRQRDQYAARLDSVKEELQFARERWSDIILKISHEDMKREHQRKLENRMRGLNRKIQFAEKGLEAFDIALSRAGDVELAAQSIKQDALLGHLGDKIDGFTVEVRQANADMTRAADMLLAKLQFEEIAPSS